MIQDGTTVTADEISEPVTEHSVILEGDQSIAVLPTFADIRGATVAQ